MRYFHSIRWRVQFWYGGLLLLVLAGFGFTALDLQRTNQFTRADRELEQRMGMIASLVHADTNPSASAPGGNPRNPPPNVHNSAPLRLPPQETGLFEGSPGQAFYYIVWRRDGKRTMNSSSAPANVPRPEPSQGHPSFRSRGTLRECFHDTSDGESILIGRDYRAEFDEMHRFAYLLSLVGGAVLLLGLAGGWWISTRALRPVSDISAAAARIADGDLGRRIHTADTGSELGQLAQNLNHTFARLQAGFTRQVQFTADASHELRTPLSVILIQTQSALSRERTTEEYRESLQSCQRAAQRMRSLMENLLMLARLDSTGTAHARETCELEPLVRDVVELMKPLAETRGVHLDMELEPARLCGNPDQLTWIVNNLVGNAIQYNKEGGDVMVNLRMESGGVLLIVSDTGTGIPADDLPHIFERFYRVDKARSNAPDHSGLGLAIVKGIVEEHGGTIDVISEVGKGSTFTVRLPGLQA